MQLLIQNVGVAATESFTLLGASTSRDSDVSGVIGQFGTGAKNAVLVLLRKGLAVRVYCGRTRIDFSTKPHVITDELGSKQVHKVVAKLTPGRTIDLGWTLEFGAIDWKHTDMALREFVSNAIDRTIKASLSVKAALSAGVLDFQLVGDEYMRAASGYTRVYVEANQEVIDYFKALPEKFLQLSDNDSLGLREKAAPSPAKVYREGVFICNMPGRPSLFDYNFKRCELDIDECRNLNEYVVRARVAEKLRLAPAHQLAKVIRAVINGDDIMESKLDSYYLNPNTFDSAVTKNKCREEWAKAWAMVAGEGVLCPKDNNIAKALGRKGFDAVPVDNNDWVEALEKYGIACSNTVLTSSEKAGRVERPAHNRARRAVRTVWEWAEMSDMTDGKERPEVKCFDEPISDGGSQCLGYYVPGTDYVAIREDLDGALLYETALEEVAHYITGATDCSRDFQNFFMRMLVRFLAGSKVGDHVAV